MNVRRALSIKLVLTTIMALTGCGPGSSLERVDSPAGKRRYELPSPSPLPSDFGSRFSVRLLNGESVSFGELVGHDTVLILNFWATWCAPCRREIPELNALHREFAGKRVRIVGLSVEDPATETEVVRMFGGQYSIPYGLGFATEEMFDAFSGSGNPVVPQTFIFDRGGALMLHLRGFHPQFREVVRGAIEKALA